VKNIYLIERKGEPNWDEFLGHVVIASDEKEAMSLCPSQDEEESFWRDKGNLTIEIIGTSCKESGVYLSSFNAS